MIWHIFRKDVRLLWPLATPVAALQLLNAGLLIGGGRFARSSMGAMSDLGWVSNIVLPGVALLGLVVLVMAVIQQDRLPGTTQDWLTRPIPRSRLLGVSLRRPSMDIAATEGRPMAASLVRTLHEGNCHSVHAGQGNAAPYRRAIARWPARYLR